MSANQDIVSVTAQMARDSLNLNPKQGEPYYWWAFALIRKITLWRKELHEPGLEVVKGGWNVEVVEDIADKISVCLHKT